jgi:hypothetical protein
VTTPTADASPPLRATGICNRCQRHTNDGILRVVDQGTGAGGQVLLCADLTVCDKKRRKART